MRKRYVKVEIETVRYIEDCIRTSGEGNGSDDEEIGDELPLIPL